MSSAPKKHVVWVLANSSSAPYFTWFAEIAAQRKDFELSFVCMFPSEPRMIAEMKQLGFRCHWIYYDANKRKRGLIASYFRLKKLFRQIRPDVVHAHLFDDSLAAIMAAKAAGVPQRITTKGDASYHYIHTPQYVRFDKMINAGSTTVIALSEESRTFILDKEGADPNKVKLVHHGLNIEAVTAHTPEFVQAFRKQWDLEGKTVIGTVSRFIPWKGYLDILDVVQKVTAVNTNVRFLFCGQGDQEQVIREKVKSMQLSEFIVFTGPVPAAKMGSLYRTMDVFLHAARNEPFGLVIAEAMLNGIPVVSTSTGAAADAVVPGEHGYVCRYGDIQALADAVLLLTDTELARKMGQHAMKRAAELFSIETGYNNHLKIYMRDQGHA